MKLVYIISDIDKALSFEWIVRLSNEFDLWFILITKKNSQLQLFLENKKVRCLLVEDTSGKTSVRLWMKVCLILRKIKPDIIHTHLWRANLVGLSVGWLLRIPKRIYTRHHATLHHREHPSGLKWDRVCNFFATVIIAISKNVEDILVGMDKANPKKIHLVHHGFDFNYFTSVRENDVERMRLEMGLTTGKHPVIGVISRYTKWKGVQFVIEAFKKLLHDFPNATLILANAKGDYEKAIKSLLAELPNSSFIEIEFEDNLAALYKLFDVFVHVPFDERTEAFGQTYVEALIAGVPSVFTLSGIAPEFIKDKENALVVPFENSESIYQSAKLLLSNPDLRSSLISKGKESVKDFSLETFLQKLKQVYAG